MPNLDSLTVLEAIWVIITLLAVVVLVELYLRSREDLKLVISTNTNGARLMVARSIRRRYVLRIAEATPLLISALIAASIDRFHAEFRWVIPVLLTTTVVALTLNAILDSRDRRRLIDYIERLETRAKVGEVNSAVQEQETESISIREET